FKSVGVVVNQPAAAGAPATTRPTAGGAVGAAARPLGSATSGANRATPNAHTSPGDEGAPDELEPIDPALLGPDATASPSEAAAAAGSDDRVLVEPVVPASGPAR